MQMWNCRQCGAPMSYHPGAKQLTCEYCGAEYILKEEPAESRASQTEVNYLGRGCLFRACMPQGWCYRVFDDPQNVSRCAAICKGLQLNAPDGAQLLFYPFAYYRSFDPKGSLGLGFTLRSNYQFDPLTQIRYRHLPSLDEYAAERMREICAQGANFRLQRLTDLDEALRKRADRFAGEASQKLLGEVTAAFGKYAVEFEQDGQTTSALFVSVVAEKKSIEKQEAPAEAPAQEPPKEPKTAGGALRGLLDFGMKGGLLGASLRGETSPLPKVELSNISRLGGSLGPNWGKLFDAVLLVPHGRAQEYNEAFNAFCTSVQFGDLYYALQDEELRQAEQILLDGQRQRTQNAINASQRLQQTLSETSSIVAQGYQRRSDRMDNIGRRRSEAIRGVNSYTAADGRTVEASVAYEHVYENTGGTFVGSKDGSATLGPDWQELKKK